MSNDSVYDIALVALLGNFVPLSADIIQKFSHSFWVNCTFVIKDSWMCRLKVSPPFCFKLSFEFHMLSCIKQDEVLIQSRAGGKS